MGGIQPVGQAGPNIGSDEWLKVHAGGDIDALVINNIVRDVNDVIVSGEVAWPDGTSGIYTTLVTNTVNPAVDSYQITYIASTITRTVLQPTVTRNANGAVTVKPRMVVN